MPDLITNLNIEDVQLTEEEKNSFDYIRKKTDYYIAALVKEKVNIKGYRDLYEGRRDPKEYEYLEKTFGLETPMSLKMTPLIKTRIDVLIGLFLDEMFTYQVSVNDIGTLDKIEEEKRKQKYKEITKGLRQQFESNVNKLKKGHELSIDIFTDQFIKNIEDNIEKGFISEFEIVAQRLISFFEKDKTIELKQKLKQMFIDLLVTGQCYYRTYVNRIGQDPIFEVCKPENIFFNKNTNFQFMSSGNKPNVTAVVHRHYMTRSQVLTEYGHLMNDGDKQKLFGRYTGSASYNAIRAPQELEYLYKKDGPQFNQHTYNLFDTVTVYHTEWLANNEVSLSEEEKQDIQNVEDIKLDKTPDNFKRYYSGSGEPNDKAYRLNRYESVRIDFDIYLNLGKSKYENRSMSTPWLTTLSYNGVSYNDRNGKAYSLAGSMKDLQDLYDITLFHRDNLIANSGVNGSRINLAGIPKVLGQNFMERVLKFIALRKQGIELIDPTEPGAALFQHYGDFNAALDANAVKALSEVAESIERQADIVSGVNRYMYQAAEQRDAVGNVKVGIKQTSLITKDIFELFFTSRESVLTDLINRAKICYKKGKRGSYIVGHRSYLFNVTPEKFCFTDHNIHIINNSRDFEKIEKVKLTVNELIKGGLIEGEVAIKITMCDSATEILEIIQESISAKKLENDKVKMLMEQLNNMSNQQKQLEEQFKKAQTEIEKLNTVDRDIKKEELRIKEKTVDANAKYQIEMLNLNRYTAAEGVKKDTAALQLEKEQIYAENAQGNSREVKNDI